VVVDREWLGWGAGGRGTSCGSLGDKRRDSEPGLPPSYLMSRSAHQQGGPPPGPAASSLSYASAPVAIHVRRKRMEEDGLGVEDLRLMLREKEKEAEEARAVMEAKQYEVRELKERLWEKLNLIDD
jgi:hypothetical protein